MSLELLISSNLHRELCMFFADVANAPMMINLTHTDVDCGNSVLSSRARRSFILPFHHGAVLHPVEVQTR